MTISTTIKLSSLALLAGVALAGASGCTMGMGGMDHGDSQGTSEVQSGIRVAREGMNMARGGMNSYHEGDHASGLHSMANGMEMMNEGMDTMQDGFDMMSGGMMSGGMMSGGMMSGEMMGECGCDGVGLMMSMHDAMEEMRQGHDMMTDDDPTNDEMGADKMDRGMNSMESGYEAAEEAVSCMGGGQDDGMM